MFPLYNFAGDGNARAPGMGQVFTQAPTGLESGAAGPGALSPNGTAATSGTRTPRPYEVSQEQCYAWQRRADKRAGAPGRAQAVCRWCSTPNGTVRWLVPTTAHSPENQPTCQCPNVRVGGNRQPTPTEYGASAKRCPDYAYGFEHTGADMDAVSQPPPVKLPFRVPTIPGPGFLPNGPFVPGFDPRRPPGGEFVPGPNGGGELGPPPVYVPEPEPEVEEEPGVLKKYWWLWLLLAGSGGYYLWVRRGR